MNPTQVPPISSDDLREAAGALGAVAVHTPLVESPALSRQVGVPVWLKCEQLQPIGAFKIRGAFTAISRLAPEIRSRGIVTHSSGNHGQAVAFVAKYFGVRAVVVMPESAPRVKVEGVKRHGAEIIFSSRKEREERSRELIEREGLVLVAPYDDPNIVLGQGTCAFEILSDHPEIGTLITPVGGGGMLAGTSAAVAAAGGSRTVIGVEPAKSPKLAAALEAGKPVSFEPVETLADGLIPISIGTLTLQYIKPIVRQAIGLTEDEIAAGVRFLFQNMGLTVEPSGATPVAALLAGKIEPTSATACVLTGGNVDPALFQRLVA